MKRLLLLTILAIGINIVQANDYPALIKPSSISQSTQRETVRRNLSDLNNAIAIQEIDVDLSTLLDSDIVSLDIDGNTMIVNRIDIIQNETEKYIYCAYESDDAEVSISKLGNNIQGIINSPFGSYIIETVDDNSYILAELDTDNVESDGPELKFNGVDSTLLELVNNLSNVTRSGDIKYVRVLVMYTPNASSLSSNMTNKVYQEINNGNTSFRNSDVNVRFELAYLGQTDDDEGSYTFNDLLNNFTSNNDGFADEVHSLRERYSADVCVLLVYNDDYCGLAWVNANKSHAFAVVRASAYCATKYSFTHEIGHNAGCLHDTLKSSTNNPYTYGHGYVHYTGLSDSSWRTMMAYGDACNGELNCVRIKYWSNPDINYNGNPTGNVTRCNNARVWNENAIKVSSFNTDPATITVTSADNSTMMDYACWRATQTITASNYSVENGQTVEMLASNSITLLPGTTIKAGANFRAAISSQSPNANYPLFTPQRHGVIAENKRGIDVNIKLAENNLDLTLSLENDCQNATIRVYDMLGRLQQTIVSDMKFSRGENEFSTNISNLSEGVYVLVTQIDGKIITNSFTKL